MWAMWVVNDPLPFVCGLEGIVHILFHKFFLAYSTMVPSGFVGRGAGWMMKVMACQKNNMVVWLERIAGGLW